MTGDTGYFDTWAGSCGAERIERLVCVMEGEYMDLLCWDRKDTSIIYTGRGVLHVLVVQNKTWLLLQQLHHVEKSIQRALTFTKQHISPRIGTFTFSVV